MSASPLSFLRAGPPPPKVVLLPDAMFFSRAVPVAAGANAAEAATQVELALEGIAPFPLAQLYYGWFWVPASEHALVFAAYRRRFTTEQTAAWAEAELVLPAFAAVVGAEVDAATTVILNSPSGVTGVHWDHSPVPAKVLACTLEPEATDDDRAKARADLLQALGGPKKVIELDSALIPDPATNDREVVFRSGNFVSRLASQRFAALDVRDKLDLASLRSARRRDVVMWRVALSSVAALLLLAIGELALIVAHQWQDRRLATVKLQKPTVDQIMNSQALANRIDELATKRLLPFEMINVLFEEKRKPTEISFLRVVTLPATGIYTLTIDGTSTNAAQVPVYEATLRKLPMIQRLEVREYKTRGEMAEFTWVVTFKPDTIKPAESISQ